MLISYVGIGRKQIICVANFQCLSVYCVIMNLEGGSHSYLQSTYWTSGGSLRKLQQSTCYASSYKNVRGIDKVNA